MHELSSANLVWLIPSIPLIGFLINAFFGNKIGKPTSGALATLAVFASFVVSIMVLMSLQGGGGERRALVSILPGAKIVPWIHIGVFKVDFVALIDPLSMLMCLIVTGIGGLIHLYAMGYMAEDKDYPRFFTYLNLFIFFMLMLVLGGNFLLMFVGWEGVGLCSYLLISFWFTDMENSKAGNKAFIVNRIGDVGFALGIMAVFAAFKTLTYYSPDGTGFLDLARKGIISGGLPLEASLATVIAISLFIGACGKSAQFPLYIWLPDAMAGPTPVSALIHAATMVTAGVVMLTRVSPIIVLSSTAMTLIACIGLFTAIFAASIALTQNDIKKVLAYSTVSQLGYMFLACGVGAFAAGMFHVVTHAFFKALLFLGAGSVIHAMHHEQDMRKMGGLRKKIPVTYWTMFVGWLAICGIFPLAGFWSKDEILGYASGYPQLGMLFYGVGLLTACMTAFYMSRLMWKTFWSDQRFDENALGHHDAHVDVTHGHSDNHDDAIVHAPKGVHESPLSMTLPLMILAVPSILAGWLGHNGEAFTKFLEPSLAEFKPHEGVEPNVGMIIGCSVGILGIVLAWMLYSKKRQTGEFLSPAQKASNRFYQGSVNLWGYDAICTNLGVVRGGWFANIWAWFDKNVIDGVVNLVAFVGNISSESLRRLQTGFVRTYALSMLIGIVAVVAVLLWPIIGK